MRDMWWIALSKVLFYNRMKSPILTKGRELKLMNNKLPTIFIKGNFLPKIREWREINNMYLVCRIKYNLVNQYIK